ncbi:hypothetical protein [uncultured Psychroserpens sp.]|uniref:hypothetical protein n=1 Tax=uncultured Psychroserpens sp. TaxID=255436 RepID=UPI0026369456|nr:hypothetical protein [uncultured Psychroserpens sp.]
MKLIHRIGYYLGGFSIGLIILAFFLSGKKTSCAYGPNARTVKNISIKKKVYSSTSEASMLKYNMDTLDIANLIKTGKIDFSESNTKSDGCKTYLLENTYEEKSIQLQIQNCDSTATIQSIVIKL